MLKDLVHKSRSYRGYDHSVKVSREELLKLVRAEGVELTDEQMDNISGGDWDDSNNCPLRHRECEIRHGDAYYCPDCNLDFLVV